MHIHKLGNSHFRACDRFPSVETEVIVPRQTETNTDTASPKKGLIFGWYFFTAAPMK